MARVCRHHRLFRRGFTLLEILSATMISAILLGALYAVYNGALKLRQKNYGSMEAGLPRAYAAEIMDRDFRNMLPPVGILAGAIIGETSEQNNTRYDRAEFFASTGAVTDKEPWGDIQKVEYYLADSEEGDTEGDEKNGKPSKDLVRAVTRNLLASTTEGPIETRLLKGVRSLTIAYYDGAVWQDSWDSTTLDNALPKAVNISIEFAPESEKEETEAPLELLIESAASAVSSQSGTNVSSR